MEERKLDLNKGCYIEVNCDEHGIIIRDKLVGLGLKFYSGHDKWTTNNIDWIYFGDVSQFSYSGQASVSKIIVFSKSESDREKYKKDYDLIEVTLKDIINHEK